MRTPRASPARRLPGANHRRQRHVLLELVPTRGPDARCGEPAIIAGLTESIRDEFAIPSDRVFIAGLSAGGAMAAVMGETYPDSTLRSACIRASPMAPRATSCPLSPPCAAAGLTIRPRGRPRPVHRGLSFSTAPRTPPSTHRMPSGSLRATAEPKDFPIGARTVGETRAYLRIVAEREEARGIECWMIQGGEHAWSGGHPSGCYTDPHGPDASQRWCDSSSIEPPRSRGSVRTPLNFTHLSIKQSRRCHPIRATEVRRPGRPTPASRSIPKQLDHMGDHADRLPNPAFFAMSSDFG